MSKRDPFEASVQGLEMLLAVAILPYREISIEREYRFHQHRRWRFDMALPSLKIGIEYHGGYFMKRAGGHQTVSGAQRDWEKLNEAQIMGWMVLQFGAVETRTGQAMEVIERAIDSRFLTDKP